MSLIGTGNPIGRPPGSTSARSEEDPDVSSLELMRRRWESILSVDAENRMSYTKNVRISSSNNQWDEEVKKRRGSNRPALTFNLLNLVVKQIIGDYRQNKMAIKVLPSGGPATEDIADILAGIIRNIERDSNADHAYTNALECAARGGFGYFRVRSVYEANDVFNQKLIIEPVHNPLTVGIDPDAKLITRSDANWAFITEKILKTEFRHLYPNAVENGWDIVDVNADSMDDWGDDDYIRVCEYFTKVKTIQRLVAFDSGAVLSIDDDKEIEALEQIGWHVTKEREAERTNIKWQKCTGSAVIEEQIYKTKYIPIIPVLGEEVNIEGKTCLRGAVYYGIDAQHSYNYERSTAIENSALTARAPWKVTNKMIEMWRGLWDNANTTPQPYLVYTPDPAVPQGPERIEPATPSAANMVNSQAAAQDIQRTTGVFNSQVGEQSNVVSGIGLTEQQHQGTTSTFIFIDNLRAGISYAGEVLIDWIPQIYDTERTLRIINSEDDIEMQQVNQKKPNPLLAITETLNDITVGEYDIVVTAGKAFASRRREAVEGMMKFAQAFPQQAPLVADLMIKNMDVPGGDVMAERIKRSLPPNVVTDPDSPEGQQAAQAAQQQQQMQQQMVQSKLQVEHGKNQAQMAKASAEVQKAGAEVIKAKADTIQAVVQTHTASVEHAAHLLDQDRTGSPAGHAMPQGTGAGADGVSPTATAPAASQGMQLQVVKSPEDVAREKEIHEGLSAIAQHLAHSHQAAADRSDHHAKQMHQMMGAIAQHMNVGHQAIAQAMHRQNEIAEAPTEAVRDKTGRVTGSKKKLRS